MLEAALEYARTHRQDHLDGLLDLLRIPSVSTKPEHAPDMQKTAQWLLDTMWDAKMQNSRILPTAGYPVVYGEWTEAGADAFTLLIYGHYDVQPSEPDELWHTPPFEPTIRDNNIYCRGAADDKGQIFAVLAAIESYLRTGKKLPINIKVLLEGEEEISSPNMAAFVRENREMLKADALLICDSEMRDPQTPMITYGVRGLCYLDMIVRGPASDLHSGVFGAGVDNPFNVLARILAQLQDGETRRILIPGFYDSVQEVPAEERALLRAGGLKDEEVVRLTGVPHPAGEVGYSFAEHTSIRPSFDIHGIHGGFSTPGGKKTVLPSEARAKLSMRLVPHQDPHEIFRLFESYVKSIAPDTVTVEVELLGTALPGVMDYQAPAIQAAAQASERVFPNKTVFMRLGGTLPIVQVIQSNMDVPVVMLGMGLPDDNLHAPNEKFHIPNLYGGIETLIHYFDILGGLGK